MDNRDAEMDKVTSVPLPLNAQLGVTVGAGGQTDVLRWRCIRRQKVHITNKVMRYKDGVSRRVDTPSRLQCEGWKTGKTILPMHPHFLLSISAAITSHLHASGLH